MAKQNQFAQEYLEIARKLAGLDPVIDVAAVKQLKNGKAAICRSWRSTCPNNASFKAELQAAQFELLPEGQQREVGEQYAKDVAALAAHGKAKAKAGLK